MVDTEDIFKLYTISDIQDIQRTPQFIKMNQQKNGQIFFLKKLKIMNYRLNMPTMKIQKVSFSTTGKN
jgi:hypothetical protein